MQTAREKTLALMAEFKKQALQRLQNGLLEQPEHRMLASSRYHASYHQAKLTGKIGKENYSSLPVVLLGPTSDLSKDAIAELVDAEEFLRNEGVPPDFNHYSLYSNTQGVRLGVAADQGNLSQFIQKNQGKLRWKTVLDIIAQIHLALYDHHIRDMAHCNIDPENFLVFFQNGAYQVKLNDHQRTSGNNGLIKYDLYKLGAVLVEARKLMRREPMDIKARIDRVIQKLQHPIPDERISVLQVMTQMCLFGRTPQQRHKFLAKIRARVRKNLPHIDGYVFHPVAVDDPFFILDKSIKPLYQAAEEVLQVAEQIETCRQMLLTHKSVEISSQLNLARQGLFKFSKALKKLPQPSAELVEIERSILAEMAAFATDKWIVAALLKQVVLDAYADYVRINHLEAPMRRRRSFDFFALHGETGREQALELKRQVEQAEDDPPAILRLMHHHVIYRGGRHWGNSFKTILQKKLLNLDQYKSFANWQAYADKSFATHLKKPKTF